MTTPERVFTIHLAKLLEDRGMTQAQLADVTGIRRATINDLYHNRSKQIPVNVIVPIIKALNLNGIEELMSMVPIEPTEGERSSSENSSDKSNL